MDLKPLSADLSVSAQITAADLPAIKEAGFRTIICNRPDNEDAGQPAFEDIAHAAKTLGLETVFQPVTATTLTQDAAKAFNTAATTLPGPVLAYCRTGTRCAALWSLSQAGKRSLVDILAATKAAGYDMSAFAARIASAATAS